MKAKPSALAAAMLAIGIAACGTPPTAQSLVSQGLKAQLAGDASTAESTYQQAIKLDPNNAVAHYNLGTVYDRQGNTSQAVTEYTATLVISPTFTDALFNLAVDTATSDPAGAQRLYLRVLALQPTFAAAWLNLGFIVQGEGKPLTQKRTGQRPSRSTRRSRPTCRSRRQAPSTKPVTPPSTSQP